MTVTLLMAKLPDDAHKDQDSKFGKISIQSSVAAFTNHTNVHAIK